MKSKYALLALSVLARAQGKGWMLISEISSAQRIPHKFLELILLELKNLGFLSSKKGRGGGYALARQASLIRVGEVVRCLEGPVAPLPCATPRDPRPCDECRDFSTCGLRMVMQQAGDAMSSVLDATTLADVLSQEDAALEARARDSSYHI